MTSPRIVTHYNPPSTPGNARDWSAIDDLIEKMEEKEPTT